MVKFSAFLLVILSYSFVSCQTEAADTSNISSETNELKLSHPHVLDYINLEVDNWEHYCSLSKNETNKEILGEITYYTKNGEEAFSSNVGVRLSGVFIRKLPQKSIAIDFSKKKWGSSKVNFPLFPSREYDDVDSFVLRAHGNPKNKTYFKDAVINETLKEQTDLVYSAYRPVILYINGKYNGLYNVREKKNKDLIKNLYGFKKKETLIYDVAGGKLVGENQEWEELIEFVTENDLTISKNYDIVSDKIDIDDLIDYHLAHVFFANTDWPKANVKIWKQVGRKWRYIFFDCDRCYNSMNQSFNGLEHIIGEDQWAKRRKDNKIDARLNNSSVVIRNLARNERFVNKLILRYQDLLNTTFATTYQQKMILEAKDKIYHEVENHIHRWLEEDKKNEVYQYIENIEQYNKHINEMMRFADKRPDIQRSQLNSKWSLGGLSKLDIKMNIQNAGKLKINTIETTNENYFGSYFNSKLISILAIPQEGYQFVGWEGIDSDNNNLEVYPKEIENGITAIFKKIQ